MMTAKEYIDSLRKLNTRVYMFGEKLDNWVDHPMIRPSINCVAMTYALAQDPQYEELMTATSSLTGHKINRVQRLMLIEGFGELLDTDNRLHDAASLKKWLHRGGLL